MPTPPTRLTSLLDALHCGAALVDRRSRYAHVNPRLAAMHGRPAAEMQGKPVAEAYRTDDARRQLAELLGDFEHPSQGEFFLEPPDAAPLPVVFAARPFTPPETGPPATGSADPGGNGNVGQSPGAGAEYLVVTVIEIAQQKQTLDHMAELSDTVMEQALRLRDDNSVLEARVRQRTAELYEANMSAITMLAVASEARDEDTGAHVKRIEAYTKAVALELKIPGGEAEAMGTAAILHDVGKIHVPDHILKKPGRLTDQERAQMQEHTLIGERILSDSPFFATARLIARHHHENHDGSGYPDGLAGDAIPLSARIVHVVDVYDALSSPRVYKDAWSPEKARSAVTEATGWMFDPAVVDAFLVCLDRGRL